MSIGVQNVATLSNGEGDGTASVIVDPFGGFTTLQYDPVGPVGNADTTFFSGVWFSGAGKAGTGGQGTWLANLPKVEYLIEEPSRTVSQWTHDNLRFELDQELRPSNGRGSTFRQVYSVTNLAATGTNFDLIRHVDGDLSFDGSIQDLAGVSQSEQLLYEFDSGNDPLDLTTFVGIDLGRNANLGFQIAPYNYSGAVFSQGRGALKNQVVGDQDANGVTDAPYDVTMSLGQTFVVPPGETVQLVTHTLLGEGTAGLVTELFRIVPRSGGSNSTVSATISGAGFPSGDVAVRLRGSGKADVVGMGTSVLSPNSIRTVFDLTGAPPGPRDVEISLSDGNVLTIPGGFTVDARGAPELWVDVTGRNAIRVGREQTYTVLYGNRGNADAFGVPLWLTGIPAGSTYRVDVETEGFQLPGGFTPVDWSQVPIVVDEGETFSVPLFVGFVPAGHVGSLHVTVTVPDARTFQLGATVSQPYINPAANPAVMRALHNQRSPAARQRALDTIAIQATGSQVADCGIAIVQEMLTIAGVIPGVGCVAQIALWQAQVLLQVADTALEGWQGSVNESDILWSFGQLIVDLHIVAWECSIGEIPLLSQAWSLFSIVQGALEVREACAPLFSWEDESELEVITVGSFDPNDKVGAQGTGPARYLSGTEPLRYTIFFENLETATAPAQEVVVTDQLDLATLDPYTFSLGRVQFGTTEVVPEPGQSEWLYTVDLRPQKQLLVRISARLDPFTGLATWRFLSLDPATNQPPDDPFAGFLPPNVTPPEGDGSVSFTIQPRANLSSGTVIANSARIVFDTNEPIDTPVWQNTIDFVRPQSTVQALQPSYQSNLIQVGWSGSDDTAGVRDYSVYVSQDDGPFVPWLLHTSAGSGTFVAEFGHHYAFYSVARDYAGNLEALSGVADTSTSVIAGIDALIATVKRLQVARKIHKSAGNKLLSVLKTAKQRVARRQYGKAVTLLQGKFLKSLTTEERKHRVTAEAAAELRSLEQAVVAALTAASSHPPSLHRR